MLGTLCPCYNNNCLTKLWYPAHNFSIYTWFLTLFSHYFIEQFSMLFLCFSAQKHHSKLIWTFQTHWVESSTQSSIVINNIFSSEYSLYYQTHRYKNKSSLDSLYSHYFYISLGCNNTYKVKYMNQKSKFNFKEKNAKI